MSTGPKTRMGRIALITLGICAFILDALTAFLVLAFAWTY